MGDKKLKIEIEVEIQDEGPRGFYVKNRELNICVNAGSEDGALKKFFDDFIMLYYKLNEKNATLTTEYKYILSIINSCITKKKRKS